jgi:hypothetical protein
MSGQSQLSLLFCATFNHESEDIQVDEIAFQSSVLLSHVRLIPRGRLPHPELPKLIGYALPRPAPSFDRSAADLCRPPAEHCLASNVEGSLKNEAVPGLRYWILGQGGGWEGTRHRIGDRACRCAQRCRRMRWRNRMRNRRARRVDVHRNTRPGNFQIELFANNRLFPLETFEHLAMTSYNEEKAEACILKPLVEEVLPCYGTSHSRAEADGHAATTTRSCVASHRRAARRCARRT